VQCTAATGVFSIKVHPFCVQEVQNFQLAVACCEVHTGTLAMISHAWRDAICNETFNLRAILL
jgi:hypothetical protein